MHYTHWNGNIAKYIDTIVIKDFNHVTTGCFGGSSLKGAHKNEDGYILLTPSEDSTLAILFDAHTTNESLLYMTERIEACKEELHAYCLKEHQEAFPLLQSFFADLLNDKKLMDDCESLNGETAMLVCFQKDSFLWWLSIGDNSLYVYHKEFNELGQYRINPRIFYQWVGNQNSLGLPLPCFSSGAIELRPGNNRILMLTDGVLEIEGRPFEDDAYLADIFANTPKDQAIKQVLKTVKDKEGLDNATILAWDAKGHRQALRPSR